MSLSKEEEEKIIEGKGIRRERSWARYQERKYKISSEKREKGVK